MADKVTQTKTCTICTRVMVKSKAKPDYQYCARCDKA